MDNEERLAGRLLPGTQSGADEQGRKAGLSANGGTSDLCGVSVSKERLGQTDDHVGESSQDVAQSTPHRISGAEAKGYVSTEEVEYLDPKAFPPPKGAQVMLLTIGGIGIRGCWSDDGSYVGWYPMPRVPAWARQLLTQRFFHGPAT